MPYEFKMTRLVEFAETDMAGIMHFANYFRYMEAVEHAFFRSLGLSVHETTAEGMNGFARIHASCDYLAPLRYQDEVEIHLLVVEKRSKSITYEAIFRKLNDSGESSAGRSNSGGSNSGGEIARGRWTVVCVAKDRNDAQLKSVTFPPDVDSKIEVAHHALLGTTDE